MTWDKFYAKVSEKFSYTSKWGGRIETQWTGTPEYYEVEWRTGGLSGGNCWGDKPSYAVDADPVPDMDLLDEFLEEVCPNLSFMSYKRILRNVVEQDSRTSYEYYGNYTNYGIKKVYFLKLYDALKSEGLL